jgi:hypothetical protein
MDSLIRAFAWFAKYLFFPIVFGTLVYFAAMALIRYQIPSLLIALLCGFTMFADIVKNEGLKP